MEWDISLLCYGLAVGLCAGVLAGLMAGLAGVGGGLIYVPVFYFLMPDSSAGMAVAIFASMTAISLTSCFSAYRHWQLKHVNMLLFYRLWPGLLLGASLGLWSALILPELWILMALAVLNIWVAYDYGRNVSTTVGHRGFVSFLGLPIGYVSGVLGIAGGTMLVPLLRRFVVLKDAVGTSAMCAAVMVALAVLLNLSIESGWHHILQGQWSFLLAAWTGLLLTMPFAAKISASWHDKFHEHRLRMVLKVIFTLIAISFVIIVWLQ